MECLALHAEPLPLRRTEHETIPVPSTESTNPGDPKSRYHQGSETRASPPTSPSKRKSGFRSTCGDEQMPAKRGRVDGFHHRRSQSLLEHWSTDYVSTAFKDHQDCNSTQRDQARPYHTDGACKPARVPARRYTTSSASEAEFLRGFAKDVPRTLSENRPADPHPKPLCMIPFNVSMSDARTGKFGRAHEPVFVYLAVKMPVAEIRIRLTTAWIPPAEMKVQPFHDGKSITKGLLAMSIAQVLEKVLTTNKLESSEELFFVELVQECKDTFRPNFKTLPAGA